MIPNNVIERSMHYQIKACDDKPGCNILTSFYKYRLQNSKLQEVEIYTWIEDRTLKTWSGSIERRIEHLRTRLSHIDYQESMAGQNEDPIEPVMTAIYKCRQIGRRFRIETLVQFKMRGFLRKDTTQYHIQELAELLVRRLVGQSINIKPPELDNECLTSDDSNDSNSPLSKKIRQDNSYDFANKSFEEIIEEFVLDSQI